MGIHMLKAIWKTQYVPNCFEEISSKKYEYVFVYFMKYEYVFVYYIIAPHQNGTCT